MNTRHEANNASREVEVSDFDLRYENCRLKQAAVEERLLGSIAERGIEEALYPSHVEAPILRVGVVPVHREGEDAQRTYERESETAFGLPAGQAGACGSES